MSLEQEKYNEYVKKSHKELAETKKKMESSGWTFVCLTPNIMTFEEWETNNCN